MTTYLPYLWLIFTSRDSRTTTRSIAFVLSLSHSSIAWPRFFSISLARMPQPFFLLGRLFALVRVLVFSASVGIGHWAGGCSDDGGFDFFTVRSTYLESRSSILDVENVVRTWKMGMAMDKDKARDRGPRLSRLYLLSTIQSSPRTEYSVLRTCLGSRIRIRIRMTWIKGLRTN